MSRVRWRAGRRSRSSTPGREQVVNAGLEQQGGEQGDDLSRATGLSKAGLEQGDGGWAGRQHSRVAAQQGDGASQKKNWATARVRTRTALWRSAAQLKAMAMAQPGNGTPGEMASQDTEERRRRRRRIRKNDAGGGRRRKGDVGRPQGTSS